MVGVIGKINQWAPLPVNGWGGLNNQSMSSNTSNRRGGKKISQWAPLPVNDWARRKNKSIGSATSKWLVKKFNEWAPLPVKDWGG